MRGKYPLFSLLVRFLKLILVNNKHRPENERLNLHGHRHRERSWERVGVGEKLLKYSPPVLGDDTLLRAKRMCYWIMLTTYTTKKHLMYTVSLWKYSSKLFDQGHMIKICLYLYQNACHNNINVAKNMLFLCWNKKAEEQLIKTRNLIF